MSNPNESDLDLQNNADLLSDLEPDWQSVPVGATVNASDGQTVGSVREIGEDGLFVDSATDDEDEFFVTAADIATIDADGVKLLVDSTEVMRARPETDADNADSDANASQPN